MKLFDEIRNQSPTTRYILFALSVIATLSIIGVIWFNVFQKQVFALLNPGQDFNQEFAARKSTETSLTPLALAGKGLDGLRAVVYEFLNLNAQPNSGNTASEKDIQASGGVYPLPLAKDR